MSLGVRAPVIAAMTLLSSCGEADKGRAPCTGDYSFTSKPTDAQILQIGRTNLYIPISWLRSNGKLWSAGQPCPSESGMYVVPAFREGDGSAVVHRLVRNPVLLPGLEFKISNSGQLAYPALLYLPAGVDPRSSIYLVSFAGYPLKAYDPSATAAWKTKVMSLPRDHGWVQLRDTYFDVENAYPKDRSAFAFPLNSAPSAFEQHARYRFNDDIVVTYKRVGFGRWRVDFNRWRKDRQSVDALMQWLAKPPSQRDPDLQQAVGGLRPQKDGQE